MEWNFPSNLQAYYYVSLLFIYDNNNSYIILLTYSVPNYLQ